MRNHFAVLLGTIVFLATACSKEPGEGGRSEIRGHVYEQRYNSTGQPTGPKRPLPDHRVFIIYGDGDFHDDDVRTGEGGLFAFKWLRKGDYTVYIVSECGDGSGCTKIVKRTASVGRKEVVSVGEMIMENW